MFWKVAGLLCLNPCLLKLWDYFYHILSLWGGKH